MEDAVVPVEVWRLAQDADQTDVVVLRDAYGRHLPVWIGQWEAAAIWMELEPERAGPLRRRPMTHDLFIRVLDRLGAHIERVVVDDYYKKTYYAKLFVQLNGKGFTMDCRPSDGIALALRARAPILVAEDIMSQGPYVQEIEEPETEESGIEESEQEQEE